MEKSTNSTRKRLGRKSSKLRRLNEKNVIPKDDPAVKSTRLPVFKILTIILPLSLMIFCFLNGTPILDFATCYRKHYNEIVYGGCNHEMNTMSWFANMPLIVFRQREAIDKIELALSNKSKFTSLALVGPPGVGKTFFATKFMDRFPWPKNALRYAWNTFVNDELEKFQMLRYFLSRLSECGRNLLIIDNLVPCDKEIVPLMHEMFEQIKQLERKDVTPKEEEEKYLIVIFVFTLNTMLDAETYNKQNEMLQVLPNTTTINFRSFDEADVRDCILQDLLISNITITDEKVNKVLTSVNPKVNGCKNVHAKVLMHCLESSEKASEIVGNDMPQANHTKGDDEVL